MWQVHPVNVSKPMKAFSFLVWRDYVLLKRVTLLCVRKQYLLLKSQWSLNPLESELWWLWADGEMLRRGTRSLCSLKSTWVSRSQLQRLSARDLGQVKDKLMSCVAWDQGRKERSIEGSVSVLPQENINAVFTAKT